MYDQMYWFMNDWFLEGEQQAYLETFTCNKIFPAFDDTWGTYCMGGEL